MRFRYASVPTPFSERANLKAVVMDNGLYVTTKDRAKELIKRGEAEQAPVVSHLSGPA